MTRLVNEEGEIVKSMIPNSQIETMFMRICNDHQMEKYISLVNRGYIALATSYASGVVFRKFFQMLEELGQ